ncbi:MAG: D-alanyl-D-alanine carboxypeptidase/D-alanyl-D-alanine-endopeptidase [bacterium]
MKRALRLLIVFFILTGFMGVASARPFENPIAAAIKKADISNSALISVSFKELSTGKKAFELNPTAPMTPASIQKIVTLLPSLDTLGKDYEFKTQLYKNGENNLYIKLGADPYFTTRDLKDLIKNLSNYKIYTTKAFYIDDSILDSNEWGEGWQWDDDLNPSIPKFGSYNMDKNLLTVNICPTVMGAPAEISTNVFYPTAFINNIITAEKTDVKLERKNYISPDVINADGTVSKEYNVEIPVNYPRRYFILRLEDILRKQKVAYYGDFNRLKLPKNTYMLAETKHPLSLAMDDILKKSNNMTAETVFKLAGGKYTKETGSASASTEMLNDYYKKQGINTDNIRIVDGSGVSKNNLISSDFMTEVLLKASQEKNFDDFKIHMATPGEGTLTDRMLYFKDKIRAKTGTLSNISSIAGYLTTKSGKTYAFCIMVNDSKSKSADKKSFEEYVLREAFDKL